VKEIPQLLIKSSNPMHNLTRKKKSGKEEGGKRVRKKKKKKRGKTSYVIQSLT
jgi:hypothetical protein